MPQPTNMDLFIHKCNIAVNYDHTVLEMFLGDAYSQLKQHEGTHDMGRRGESKYITGEDKQPWIALGIDKSTFYRRAKMEAAGIELVWKKGDNRERVTGNSITIERSYLEKAAEMAKHIGQSRSGFLGSIVSQFVDENYAQYEASVARKNEKSA